MSQSEKKTWFNRIFGNKEKNNTHEQSTDDATSCEISTSTEINNSVQHTTEQAQSDINAPLHQHSSSDKEHTDISNQHTLTEQSATQHLVDAQSSTIVQHTVEIQSADKSPSADQQPPEPEPKSQSILSEKKPSLFMRLKTQLGKTRAGITSGFSDLFLGKKIIDDDILEELETRLLMADVGVSVTQQMIDHLSQQVSRKMLTDENGLFQALQNQMILQLRPVEIPLEIPKKDTPFVLLVVGVNGVGKTTTIGKLAKQFQAQGKTVMLAAGDTFRAAAVDQLKIWGDRNNIPVIAQKDGADPASVMFDAMESAKAKKIDILIADTAGRLHTQSGLMQELAKINRVIKRVDPSAPHEVMLIVDASTGQNALNQATQFNEIIPLTGISFTKLDGTAKGGIVFAIAEKLNIPVRYIGVGENIDDLQTFNAQEFVNALIGYSE